MMPILLIAFLLQDQPPLERVTYDLELTIDTRHYILRMVLNKRDSSHFSISSRKSPGGTLFTYWAEGTRDTLSFPRRKTAFRGETGAPFRLFPDGPKLTGPEWLTLLEEGTERNIGDFIYQEVDDWKMVGSPVERVTIRWRERARKVKQKYRPVVLQARVPDSFALLPMSELALTWDADEVD